MNQSPAWRTVVGVNGSTGSVAALRWAAREAAISHADLHVVHAWERARNRTAHYAVGSRRPSQEEETAAAQERLASSVRAVFGAVPPVAVVTEVAQGLAERVLLDRAAGADLLVLGEAAASPPDVVGPVVRACLSAAPCPVVVVSARREQASRIHDGSAALQLADANYSM